MNKIEPVVCEFNGLVHEIKSSLSAFLPKAISRCEVWNMTYNLPYPPLEVKAGDGGFCGYCRGARIALI